MNDSFVRGFEYVNQAAAPAAAFYVSQEWLNEMNEAVNQMSDEMARDMVELAIKKNTDDKFLRGNIAELWHQETFNMDAKLHGGKLLAEQPDVNTYASPDVILGDKQYSLKYYKTPIESADKQLESAWQRFNQKVNTAEKKGGHYSKTFEQFCQDRGVDLDKAKYSMYYGMEKLIPTDQLEQAKKYLNRELVTLENNLSPTPETAFKIEQYRDVLNKLTDIVSDGKGHESIRLSHADAVMLAKAAINGNVDKELFKACGLDVNALITTDDIVQEALSAGASAAALSVIITFAPIIASGILMLISEGEIDEQALKKEGINSLSSVARAFISGSVTSAFVLAGETGKLGSQFANLDPIGVATIVVIAVNTIDIAIKFASGGIDKGIMAKNIMRLYVTTGMSYLGGTIMVALCSGFAPAYLIGSLIGSILGGFLCTGIEKLFISLCVEDGFTFFGIVKQNYELPDEVFDILGMEKYSFDQYEAENYVSETYQLDKYSADLYDYMKINIRVLHRNMIEFGKVEYTF